MRVTTILDEVSFAACGLLSSICGTNTSSVVRDTAEEQLEGVMAEAGQGFGIVNLIQQAEATYSCHLVGYVFKISDRTFCIQAPARSKVL